MGNQALVPRLADMNGNARQALFGLLETEEMAHLGPTRRSGTLDESALRTRAVEVLSGTTLSETPQQLVLALLLLWHDHLAAAHTISQEIAVADGSFVHAMMHRREPDYWNSKYWWRQTGRHPSFDPLAVRAGDCLGSPGGGDLEKVLPWSGVWKPGAFVDACEAVADCPAADPAVSCLRQLQLIEFEVLLDHLLGSRK